MMLLSGAQMQGGSRTMETDCSDGVPRLGCKIWKVTITVGFPTNTIECETGSTWQCAGS
jgi:hypothetical protein